MKLIQGGRRRLRRLARRWNQNGLRSGVNGAAEKVTQYMRAVPLPTPLRRRLGLFRLRPGVHSFAWDRVLLGGQVGLDGADFALASGDVLWSSRRLYDGPHVRLLEDVEAGLVDLDDRVSVAASGYGRLAQSCIGLSGAFLGANSAEEVASLAKELVGVAPMGSRPGRSARDRPGDELPRVRRIQRSSCVQVADGHHRLARQFFEGASHATVRVEWWRARTAVQRVLSDMSWLGGSREIYQPVDLPELVDGWTLVRGCTDRLTMMLNCLKVQGLTPAKSQPSYLDVACAQGWFVSELTKIGFDAIGVERDPLAPVLAEAVYGLGQDQIVTADAVEFLGQDERQWDVVSCFSLVHHFALGRGEVSAERVLELLDSVTRKVLFFDTGQAHESWFEGQIDAWTADGVEEKLRTHTTFDEVVRLGTDGDGVGAYAGNYGRTLFACIRT